jgi:hypothetical protein
MNFTDPRFWLDVAVIIAAVVNTAVTWLRKPGEAAAAGLATLRTHVDDQHQATLTDMGVLRKHVDDQHQVLHRDLVVLQERIAHMPTSEELAELDGSVRELAAGQKALADAQGLMNKTLFRIEDHLLNQK